MGSSPGEKKPVFVLKEFQAAKPKVGYESVTASSSTTVIYAPSTLDDVTSASEKNEPSRQTGLVRHDDYKRLRAELEFHTERPISPTPDAA
jgi:hypothetical protein